MPSSATPLPAGLADLLFAHTGTMTREVEKGARTLQGLAGSTGGYFQQMAAHAQLMLAANRVTHAFKRSAHHMADMAVWFRGFQGTLEDNPAALQQHDIDQMLPALVHAQDLLHAFRNDVEHAKAPLAAASRSPSVRQARLDRAQGLLVALAALYAAMEGARWALLEHEADADIAQGRLSPTYTRAADLFAKLH